MAVTSPPAKRKIKKPLILGIAGAAAAVLALAFFLIFSSTPRVDDDIDDGPVIININLDHSDDDTDIDVDLGVDPPGQPDAPFVEGEAGFSTNDPNIKMIEVNQFISYGFNSDTGNFYVLENFVAGKETAVFIALEKPPAPDAEIVLTIERDDGPVAELKSYELVDDKTLLFHPEDIGEVDSWEEGSYTFTFKMGGSTATRTTNFYKAMPVKVLAIPMKNNYSGTLTECGDVWKEGVTMLTALYPVSRDDIEYVLGQEMDLTAPEYDLHTYDGMLNVWEMLEAQQTPDEEYTMIIGFMTKHPQYERDGRMVTAVGYTFGGSSTVVCETCDDALATVVHEIAHCYKIGDEYDGGGLNNRLNPPPYMMEGYDLITREDAVGEKEHVKGGGTVGLLGTGSVVYPEQRAYWPEGRQLMGTKTTYMGSGMGEDSFMYWSSSDIWNHLFQVFTGRIPKVGGDNGEPEEAGKQGVYWGQCFECYLGVYAPDGYIKCTNCAANVRITGETFNCRDCQTAYKKSEIDNKDMWIYHSECGNLLHYPKFVKFNEGDGKYRTSGDGAPGEAVTVLEIMGYFDENGAFTAYPWYSYQSGTSSLTSNRDGAYAAAVFDSNGKRLSIAYFDLTDDSWVNMEDGTLFGGNTKIPVRVVVSFPEDSAKVVIYKGNQEIHVNNLSGSAPKVAFTGITAGQKLGDRVTLTWEASDADGDKLTYQIWYYRNLGDMYLVATGVTGTSLDVDLTKLPGSGEGWFGILATDGGRTGMSETPKVSIPYKAPDILNHIPDGKQYKATGPIVIVGRVSDAQDGWLSDGFEWYIDGNLVSSGSTLSIAPNTLTAGMHTITLKVTNSAGVSSSRDFVIEVVG